MRTTIGPVPPACRQRLVMHYGGDISGWLRQVPNTLRTAAHDWGLTLRGYHDEGHASVLALAETSEGDSVVVKAWFDRVRYRRETAALRHWEPVNGRTVRAQDDERAVACLTLIGGAPGGGQRPADDAQRVAAALARLHACPLPDLPFPTLDDYLCGTVEPRMSRRLHLYASEIPQWCTNLGSNPVPAPTRDRMALLHADLYRENVPVDTRGRPVFLDPLPMIGDPAFDWAFFVVYFDLSSDPLERLALAAEAGGVGARALLLWAMQLGLDGLLYYREVGDDRESRLMEVVTVLAAEGGRS